VKLVNCTSTSGKKDKTDKPGSINYIDDKPATSQVANLFQFGKEKSEEPT
jgi:hypothetical protein